MAYFFCKTDEQALKNRRIEKELKKDKEDFIRNYILLLGTEESGKSTFMRQMRIIFSFPYISMKNFVKHIRRDMFTAMQTMIRAMDLLHIEYQDPSNRENAKLVENIVPDTIETYHGIETEIVNAIKALWNDPGVQECYERRREYRLADSANYYLTDIDRIASMDYSPTLQDIIRARVLSFRIEECGFLLEDTYYRMIDPGSLRSERRKWFHYFEKNTAVLFLAALDEYDQISNKSSNKTRMEESKALFQEIVSVHWFRNSSIVLFLNKKDIFEDKIKWSHLADYYPEYQGPKGDHKLAQEFILNMFLSLNPDDHKMIYSHFICATDTENVRFVFAAMHDNLVIRSDLHHLLEPRRRVKCFNLF